VKLHEIGKMGMRTVATGGVFYPYIVLHAYIQFSESINPIAY